MLRAPLPLEDHEAKSGKQQGIEPRLGYAFHEHNRIEWHQERQRQAPAPHDMFCAEPW